jgi:hypothetical protein
MAFSNGPRIITQGLNLLVDIADFNSYPGSGTVVTDVISKVTGSFTGSISYTSNYLGGLSFTDPSASIVFPGTNTNYGSELFAVDITFQPTQIQGIHWLFTKNSGSFPTWGAYISGSNNTGKVFVTYNVSSAISCSVSSSDFITTGSTYISTFKYTPQIAGTTGVFGGITMVINNGLVRGGLGLANNVGSLFTTASLFVANTNTLNNGFSGSIYNFKLYSGISDSSRPAINYVAQSMRYKLPQQSLATSYIRALVVGGGGPGGWNPYVGYQMGGGGGGGVVEAYTTINTGLNRVLVATARSPGYTTTPAGIINSSSFSDIVALGGGWGGGSFTNSVYPFTSGSSGGGVNGRAISTSTGLQGFDGANSAGGGAGGPAVGNIGGPGKPSDITGIVTYYGGGGAGATTDIILPSLGGGGGSSGYRNALGLPGGNISGMSGSANTGGGASSGIGDARNWPQSGGSGVVIMRYQGAPRAIGGVITSVGNDTVHTFTASGDFILL